MKENEGIEEFIERANREEVSRNELLIMFRQMVNSGAEAIQNSINAGDGNSLTINAARFTEYTDKFLSILENKAWD